MPAQDLKDRPAKLIDLDGQIPAPIQGVLETLLGIRTINQAYCQFPLEAGPEKFITAVLDRIGVSFAVPESELLQIPETGPVIVVANHPFGAIEGLILALILQRRRPDAKIIANFLLSRVTPLKDMFILVNPFESTRATSQNRGPLRQAMDHLSAGGLVGMFPAGEVAHMTWTHGVRESRWTRHVGRLVRSAECSVLPIHFAGHNSLLFQLAGLCHPRLRTALLGREMIRRGQRIDIRIGPLIPFARLGRFETDVQLAEHLRARTLSLPFRRTATAPARPVKRDLAPLIDAVAAELLRADTAALPPQCVVAQAGEMSACFARASQLPNVMREIGRLRELTFRDTGEGTGRSLDLDKYDEYYRHLFVWNHKTCEIVGGYRIGFSHEILEKYGRDGLYTHSLFRLHPDLFKRIGPSVELGRSFVRLEYQKSYAPLLLLWKGLAKISYDNPEYCNFLGPVSISANYDTNTRRLMVDFLNCHHRDEKLGELVKARNPFRHNARAMLGHLPSPPSDPEELSHLIEDLEGEGKGMPVLLRQYLKLGAKVLAFNVDPDFSDVLDALIVVNLLTADGRTISRYMGAEEYRAFVKYERKGVTAINPAL